VLCSAVLIDQTGPSAERSALPKVGLTATDIQTWVTTSALGSDGSSVSWETPTLSGAAMAGIAVMTAAERVALVHEVLGVVKTAVAAPAFQAAFAALIKQKLNAVDHGINTNTYGMQDQQGGRRLRVEHQAHLQDQHHDHPGRSRAAAGLSPRARANGRGRAGHADLAQGTGQ
jgi:hypothetical protein